MTNTHAHTIAVIPGDGIGQEVIPAGIAAIEAAARRSNVSFTFTPLPWGCDYYMSYGRMMDADGFERLADIRRDLSRRHRRADRARSHRRLGPAAPAAAAISAVREPPSDAAAARARLAAGEPQCRRHRHGLRTREHGGRVRRPRGPRPRRHAARGRRADRAVHPARHRAHPALRVRGGDEAAAPAAGQRDQVERAAALDGAVGRSRRACAPGLPGGRVPEVSRRRDRRAHGHAPGLRST